MTREAAPWIRRTLPRFLGPSYVADTWPTQGGYFEYGALEPSLCGLRCFHSFDKVDASAKSGRHCKSHRAVFLFLLVSMLFSEILA